MSQKILQELHKKNSNFIQLSSTDKHDVLENLRDLAIDVKTKCKDEDFLNNIGSWIDPNDDTVKKHAQEISGLYHLPYPTKTHCLARLILKIPEIEFNDFFRSIKLLQATYVLAYIDPTQLSYHNLENILLMDYYFKHSKLKDVAIETEEIYQEEDNGTDEESDNDMSNPKTKPKFTKFHTVKPKFTKLHTVDAYLTKFNNLQPVIQELDKPEFYLKPFNNDERGGKRFIFKSLLLSQKLTKLIKNATKRLSKFQLFSHVNPVFRLNSFENSDSKFSYHYDTAYCDKKKKHLSRYTIVIYLTKGSQEKGILNIEKKQNPDKEAEHETLPIIKKNEYFSLNEVEIGDCVIFNHKYNHQGNPFKEGKKLFIRSELVFDASELDFDHNPKLAKLFASSCYMFIESMRKNKLSDKIRQISNEQFNIANRARFNLNNKVNENNHFLIKKVKIHNTYKTTKTTIVDSSDEDERSCKYTGDAPRPGSDCTDDEDESEEESEDHEPKKKRRGRKICKVNKVVDTDESEESTSTEDDHESEKKPVYSDSDTEFTESNWKIDSDDNEDRWIKYRTRRVKHFGNNPKKTQTEVQEKYVKNQDIFMTNGTDYYFNLNSCGLQTDNEASSVDASSINIDKIKYFTILTLMDYFKGKVEDVGERTINEKIRIETMDILKDKDEQTLLGKFNEIFFRNMITRNYPINMDRVPYTIKEYEKYDISKLDFDGRFHCYFCTPRNEMDYVINKFRKNLKKLFEHNHNKCENYSLCIFDNIYINDDDIVVGKNTIKFKNSGQDSGINFASCQGCDYLTSSNMSTHEITTRIGQGFKIPTLTYEILNNNLHISIDMFNNDFCVGKAISYNTQVKPPPEPYDPTTIEKQDYDDKIEYQIHGSGYRKPLITNEENTFDGHKKQDIEIYTTNIFDIHDDSNSIFELDYIQDSELFQELGSNDAIAAIPKKYKSIKLDTNNRIIIRNRTDFYNTLDTLRYFGVTEMPYEIYDFVIQNKIECKEILENNFKDYFYEELILLVNTKIEKAYRYSEYGNPSITQTSNNYIIKQVLLNGNLNLLKYLYENKYVFQDQDYRYTIKNGHKECFKFMHYNGLVYDGCVCHWAIKYNQSKMLGLAMELGYILDAENFHLAIDNGYIDMIKYFIKKCPTFSRTKAKHRMNQSWHGKRKNHDEILDLL